MSDLTEMANELRAFKKPNLLVFGDFHKVSLFPNNTFSEPLYLQIQFPQRGRYILKEMTLSIAGSIIVPSSLSLLQLRIRI